MKALTKSISAERMFFFCYLVRLLVVSCCGAQYRPTVQFSVFGVVLFAVSDSFDSGHLLNGCSCHIDNG